MRATARESVSLISLASGMLAVLGPHFYLVLGGALASAVAATILARRPPEERRRVPLLALLAVPPLLFVGYYVAIIAGPTGLSLAALSTQPFSPAAEAMLLPPLALAAAGFFAPWPLARLLPGPALAVVGVALLVRLGHGALPGALDAWRTVFVPLAVVSLWGAALTGRARHAAAAAAFAACFAAGFGGARAAWVIAAALLVAALADALPAPRAAPRVVMGSAAAAIGALGAAFALAALLRTEVVYGVLAWAGAIVLSLRLRSRAPAE